MSGLEDLTDDKLIQGIAAEEARNAGGQVQTYRAALDVSLAKGLRTMIGNLAETTERSARDVIREMGLLRVALDNFGCSMNKGGRKMIWLTGALVFVGLVQAAAVIVQVWHK